MLRGPPRVLNRLYGTGINVPRPYDLCGELLVMEFIGGDGQAAPLLKGLSFEKEEARLLFEQLLNDIDRMLGCGVVHGDLSAYNILYHNRKAVIIDFPQAVDPACHEQAGQLFLRDMSNLCAYFSSQGIKTDAYVLAREIWQQYFPPEF